MTYETRLLGVAEQYAKARAEQIDDLWRKKFRHINEIDRIQKEIEHSEAALDRVRSYVSLRDQTYHCPICWVAHKVEMPIKSLTSQKEVFLRCRRCGWEDRHHL